MGRPTRPRIVLVMQGGGALGAFQAGVYQALQEANMEPDWIVGTSIGAINGALIAGNPIGLRVARLRNFWAGVARQSSSAADWHDAYGVGRWWRNWEILTRGVGGFFSPNLLAWMAPGYELGPQAAALYQTHPLRQTLSRLIDVERLGRQGARLSIGSVNVRTGRMRYFDTREEAVGIDHILASGALPPAFPAVSIDGEAYWDGGILSNTPLDIVMDDAPRRSSVIFAAQLWRKEGAVPLSVQEAMSRHKDIQYASRAETHTAHQQQLHELRHVISQLGDLLPARSRNAPELRALLDHGCKTVMHFVPLRTPEFAGEDHTKDIDFSPSTVAARWAKGHELAWEQLRRAPWQAPVDPLSGVVVHDMQEIRT